MAAYKGELLHNTPIYWNTSLTEVHHRRHQRFGIWIYTEFKNVTKLYKLNSQSLEDTQVGYISQKYTLDKYTLEEYTLEKYTLENF